MSRKVGKGAKGLIDPAFCCCAIPLVNAGIYSVIVEQGVVALAAGIMAISTPDVVGASFPDFALYILTAVCFIVAAVQPLGWIGVLREKTSTFRVYAWINATAVTAAFSVAAALIITSAVNHTKATAQCQLEFFTPTNGTSSGGVLGDAQTETLASQGEALCGPFAWADVGIMGGLWLILLLTQVYFLYLTKRYSTSQVSDHKLYHSVYSENPEAFTMSVLRSTRYNPNSVYSTGVPKGHQEDAWDARPSTESLREGQYQAQPGPSSYYDAGGRGDELAYQNNGAPSYEYDQYQQQQYQQQYAQSGEYGQQGHMEYGHPNQEQYGYDGQHGQYQNYPNAPLYVSHPENAMARDAGDTPTMPQYSDAHGSGWGGGDGGLRRPEGVQNHPAEGMFGRKSPRLN